MIIIIYHHFKHVYTDVIQHTSTTHLTIICNRSLSLLTRFEIFCSRITPNSSNAITMVISHLIAIISNNIRKISKRIAKECKSKAYRLVTSDNQALAKGI